MLKYARFFLSYRSLLAAFALLAGARLALALPADERSRGERAHHESQQQYRQYGISHDDCPPFG
jgi:hypothetical protein